MTENQAKRAIKKLSKRRRILQKTIEWKEYENRHETHLPTRRKKTRLITGLKIADMGLQETIYGYTSYLNKLKEYKSKY